MRLTKKLFNTNTEGKRDGKFPKRGPSQINERPTRPHSTTLPKHATNARLPSNSKNPQILGRLLRPQHNLSTTERTPKERGHDQDLRRRHRDRRESLKHNPRRTKHTELH